MGNPSAFSFASPYVHSDRANYLTYANKNSMPADAGKAQYALSDIIEQLETLSSQLRMRADQFVSPAKIESISQKELSEIFYAKGPIGDFQKAANRFLYNKNNIDLLLPDTKIKKDNLLNSLEQVKVANNKELANKILEHFQNQDIIDINSLLTVCYQLIEDALIKTINDKNITFQRTKASQAGLINEKNVAKLINKKRLNQIAKNFKTPYQSTKALAKKIANDAGISYKNLISNQNLNTEKFLTRFANYMRENFPNLNDKDQKLLQNFINTVSSEFDTLIKNTTFNTSNIIGAVQEDLVTTVIVQGNAIEIISTGRLPEIDNQGEGVKKIMGTVVDAIERKVYKKNEGQSYTDLIMVRNGIKVRVQSKNSLSSAAPVFLSGEDRSSYINLLDHEMTPFEVVKVLEASQNTATLDPAMLGYVLANDYWFSRHNSYSQGKVSGPKSTNKNSIKQLTDLILNSLGILIPDANKVNPNIINESNIFWLITGAFVPTYKIVDGIILYFKQQKKELTEFTIQIDSHSTPSALSLYQKKLEAIGESKDVNGKFKNAISNFYTDTALIEVGQEVGSEIMSNYKIKALKLKIPSMKNLLQTYQIADFI